MVDIFTIASWLVSICCVLWICEKIKDTIKWLIIFSVVIALGAVLVVETEAMKFDFVKYWEIGQKLVDFVVSKAMKQ